MLKKIFTSLLFLTLLGCSSVNLSIDRDSYHAKGKNHRIKYIVLHYTAINDVRSIRALTRGNVSSHYLVTTDRKQPIYSLVPDNERAWHAGFSSFNGRENLNDTSIGIEIVNLGIRSDILKKYEKEKNFFIPQYAYIPYSQSQIEKVAFLVNQLKYKYNISPKDIVGHGDIAPQRKKDPGPFFPWEYLYRKYNIGAWYDYGDYRYFLSTDSYKSCSIEKIKSEFRKYGYDMNDTPEWDEESRRVVYAFQCHFRPEKTNGIMDAQTFAILKALNKKYSN
ncbi:N-acetylmuramoyl-L-alanine amidase [Cetobacterium ceti]|uniref:N-acetylmuramoyl-L-alanine amidase n=1 Tax=Cetobacterium ceti TaxID=180163 RepID=A0A1T4PSV7_9FUSO|nr:N-acetylmuramoyl-L-alanine amidase [Cetobacterium ceti]SJZ94509.1 N-acetylmuramoyl-L-alanine amidase [Cetobacterium ceti]